VSTFDLYSRYYDLLYREKDYLAEVDHVAGLLERHGHATGDVLELGCGTGIHATMLAERNYQVHGIDLSAEMLAVAARRRDAQPVHMQRRLGFESGDIRSYRAGREFDAVVSLFHVFSYQSSNADLAAAFETAATHLRKGGVLICDFWFGPAVLAQRPAVRVRRLSADGTHIIRIAEPKLHFDRNVVDVDYEILIIDDADQRLQTIRETHVMRYLFMPELRAFASACGLSLERSMAWMSEAALDDTTWSGCAVFRKT
jgi:SAM-dependent methyltransferase